MTVAGGGGGKCKVCGRMMRLSPKRGLILKHCGAGKGRCDGTQYPPSGDGCTCPDCGGHGSGSCSECPCCILPNVAKAEVFRATCTTPGHRHATWADAEQCATGDAGAPRVGRPAPSVAHEVFRVACPHCRAPSGAFCTAGTNVCMVRYRRYQESLINAPCERCDSQGGLTANQVAFQHETEHVPSVATLARGAEEAQAAAGTPRVPPFDVGGTVAFAKDCGDCLNFANCRALGHCRAGKGLVFRSSEPAPRTTEAPASKEKP